jgi:hypothetical protein
MNQTFEEFWAYSRYVTAFTAALLTAPANVSNAMLSASTDPSLAQAIALGFNDPRTLDPWLIDLSGRAENAAAATA